VPSTVWFYTAEQAACYQADGYTRCFIIDKKKNSYYILIVFNTIKKRIQMNTKQHSAIVTERPFADTQMCARLLSDKGVRPSYPRLAIYQYVKNSCAHPTAETMYAALLPTIPTLSRTTVYNTLKLLEQRHLVQSVSIENDELRYDADLTDHWHFKCTKCGQVYDVYSETAQKIKEATSKALPEGFVPDKMQTHIWGLCSHCSPSQSK
jgi:ferric uptake regulator, fur family